MDVRNGRRERRRQDRKEDSPRRRSDERRGDERRTSPGPRHRDRGSSGGGGGGERRGGDVSRSRPPRERRRPPPRTAPQQRRRGEVSNAHERYDDADARSSSSPSGQLRAEIAQGATRIAAHADELLGSPQPLGASPQRASSPQRPGLATCDRAHDLLVAQERRDRRRAALESHLGLPTAGGRTASQPRQASPSKRAERLPGGSRSLVSLYAEMAEQEHSPDGGAHSGAHVETPRLPDGTPSAPFGTPHLRPRVRVRSANASRRPAGDEYGNDDLWA